MGCGSSSDVKEPIAHKGQKALKGAEPQQIDSGTNNAGYGAGGGAEPFSGIVGPLSVKEYGERLSCPEATQGWRLPKSGFDVKYVCVSLRGYYPENPYKANQDSFCAIPGFGGDPDTLFFGVFDGHGEFGTEISNYARDQVPMRLVSDEDYHTMLESAVVNSFVDTNEALHQSEIDDTMSGTTAITILVRGRDIFVANVGDSRAFIAEVDPENGNELIAEDLSHDQTPYRRDECERVRRAGATVMTLDQLEGLKNPKVDCFTEDHQILTESGFMFLDQLEAAQASGSMPRIMAFHPEDQSLAPEECQRLIVHPAAEQSMIEVTDALEAARWGPDADEYGVLGHSTGGRDGAFSSFVSVVMTKNHDVYTKSALRSRDEEHLVEGTSWDTEFRKVKAVELLPSANQDDPTSPVEVFRLLGRAENGVAIPEDEPLPRELQALFERMGVDTPEQMDAFFAVLGFWIGDGSMRKRGPIFAQVKGSDVDFVQQNFAVLGWEEGDQYLAWQTGRKETVFAIQEPSVCEFFISEWGVKYGLASSSGAQALDKPAFGRASELPETVANGASAALRTNASDPSSAATASSREEQDPLGPPRKIMRTGAYDAFRSGRRDFLMTEERAGGALQEIHVNGQPRETAEGGVAVFGPDQLEPVMEEMDSMETGTRRKVKSVKWFPQWMWRLCRRWLRAILRGLHVASGAQSSEHNTIVTSDIEFRDDLIRACILAGYSAHFQLMSKKGTIQGKVNGSDVRATHDSWAVSFVEDARLAEPTMVRREAVKEVPYSGRTFCVTVPSGLIVVRRAFRNVDGAITKASAPIVIGNCWTTEMEDDGDPPRLWLPNAMFPGTAFTRSIGDSVAERIGVVAVPEICLKRITARSRFAVIASDGVFEFLASQNVADILSRFDDPLDGARAVVSESYRLWLENEMRTDDITIIVVCFDNVPDDDDEALPAAMNGNQTQVVSATFIEPRGSATMPDGEREPPEPIESPEEIDALDRAMRTNFLFANLSDDQRRSIYSRMQRHVFYPGDIVIRQGDKGDNFYVVRDGILDVYISQGEGDSSLVHTYKASDGFHPSFGELALMHGKPRAATVVARTRCTLWALDRDGFRSQVQRHSPQWLIQLLQGVDCLRPLKFSQLELMVNFMEELAFQDGEMIVRQGDEGDAFYIVTSGEVAVTIQRSEGEEPKHVLTLQTHQYFGEKALLSSARRAASVYAKGFVRLLYITRSTFERILGPLTDLDAERQIWEENCRALAERRRSEQAGPLPTSAEDLSPNGTLLMTPTYALIRCQIGRDSFIARVTSVADVTAHNLQEQVLRSREVVKTLDDYPSPLIPPVARVFRDDRMLVEIMRSNPVCTMAHLARDGVMLNEDAARYVAASVAVALDHMHRAGKVYRSLALDSIAFTDKGQVHIVDFRYSRPIVGHCYSMTGVPEFTAPEMIEQKGYTEASDWWAFGVLVYTLLVGRTPFAHEGENELQLYRNITASMYSVPSTVSQDAAALIQSLIVREPMQRLGVVGHGMGALRRHPWFKGVPWDQIETGTASAPRFLMEVLASFRGLDNRQFVMAESRGKIDTSWVDKF